MSIITQKERLREILRTTVPPFLTDKLTRDLCDDVLESFAALYPDQALSLCMRIAQRLTRANQEEEKALKSSKRKHESRIAGVTVVKKEKSSRVKHRRKKASIHHSKNVHKKRAW